MNQKNNKKPLDISSKNIPKNENPQPMTPHEASKAMAEFYSTMGNCLLNLVSIHSDISESLRDISSDTSELVVLAIKQALKSGAIDELEAEEMLNPPDDKEPPANSEQE